MFKLAWNQAPYWGKRANNSAAPLLFPPPQFLAR